MSRAPQGVAALDTVKGPLRRTIDVTSEELLPAAIALLGRGYRLALVAAVDATWPMRVVYLFTSGPPDRRIELVIAVVREQPEIPSLAAVSFPASRFERELHDLFGITPVGHPFLRRLALHQHWPEGWHPMRRDAEPAPLMLDNAAPYPFIEVEGTGVYEIPVGPIHAGLIEPGHFRFSVVGETIVRMKARLWFVHKGIERLFEGRDVDGGLELAERISGDTAVGHCLAYCLATEEALGIEVPERASELRVLLLELERLYNHVADVGAMCNDVGFGLVNAKALTLREQLLRLNKSVTGHRLLRGGVLPGGARLHSLPTIAALNEISAQFHELVDLALGQSTVMDRFEGTGVLQLDDVEAMGVLGVVARASGARLDARRAHGIGGQLLGFVPAQQAGGDVRARFQLRVDEFDASTEILRAYCDRPRPLHAMAVTGARMAAGSGTGIVEGWRGTIAHRVETDDAGRLTRVKVVDPSFFNWPALSVALADTIVPDFPLINKSFNLSYAGNDL
jgi:Ni,Fe-hydrogenase III large subunit/Ni,Fe-hydrogenase III component G